MIFTRRRLLLGTGALAAAGAVGFQAATRKKEPRDIHLPIAPGHQQYNILLITSDQEQAWSHLPADFIERHCPGRARLRRQSLSFTRAFTPSPVCSTARACLYSGQHSQNNGLWENIPLPYASPMKKSVPTLGTLMSAAGYHTAYFGKWHLSRLRNRDKSSLPAHEVQAEILSYGFDEAGTHQELDGPLGGHLEDTDTTNKAVDFVQRQTKNDKPWFTAVNLLNPHDIMYYTAGAEMTATRKINYPDKLARPPQTGLYSEQLGYPLPENFGPGFQSEWTQAAAEYALCDDIALGQFPYDDPAACDEYVNYYYNCIRESDAHIVRLLDALDASGQAERTIVVFTADHGEMLGVHGLRNKGVVPYRETVQIPLLVRHPDAMDSRSTEALASHIDMAPTLLNFAGVPSEAVASEVPELVGRNLSGLVLDPDNAGPRDNGEGILLHWTSLAYQDHLSALAFGEERKKGGGTSFLMVLKPQFRGSLTNRGQMRGVFDGRYKFARFFAPTQHNLPQTWDDLIALNDLELYDTQADPGELNNLATNTEIYRDLLLTMNDKLNTLITKEIGDDDGHHMPGPSFIWRA